VFLGDVLRKSVLRSLPFPDPRLAPNGYCNYIATGHHRAGREVSCVARSLGSGFRKIGSMCNFGAPSPLSPRGFAPRPPRCELERASRSQWMVQLWSSFSPIPENFCGLFHDGMNRPKHAYEVAVKHPAHFVLTIKSA
jgi:hypothetical protein